MKKNRIKILIGAFFSIFCFSANNAYALNLRNAFSNTQGSPFGALVTGAHYNPAATSPTILGFIISVILSILGIVFIILIIYGGYTWMIARGEEQKVTKGKDTITAAVIGLLIIMAAYAISYFVTNALVSPFMQKQQSGTTVIQPSDEATTPEVSPDGYSNNLVNVLDTNCREGDEDACTSLGNVMMKAADESKESNNNDYTGDYGSTRDAQDEADFNAMLKSDCRAGDRQSCDEAGMDYPTSSD